jgi:hypothetical protein
MVIKDTNIFYSKAFQNMCTKIGGAGGGGMKKMPSGDPEARGYRNLIRANLSLKRSQLSYFIIPTLNVMLLRNI